MPTRNSPSSPESVRRADEPDAHTGAAARLTVDLGALQANYRAIDAATAARTGAVVKANAYGSGMGRICRTLQQAGCDTFFIALASEAVVVRKTCPDADIYVLSPVISVDHAILIEHRLIPCLYCLTQMDQWIAACALAGHTATAALHVETGIHRAGMAPTQVKALADDAQRLRQCRLTLIMGHMACGDVLPDTPADAGATSAPTAPEQSAQNRRQLQRFSDLRALFPQVPASLCNSATARLGEAYHFDLIRAGISLFGHDPHYRHLPVWCEPVLTLKAIVAQIHHAAEGERVGYGGTFACERDTRLAVVLAGYADGVPWALGRADATSPDATGEPAPERYHAWINGHRAPLVGRVSMDMVTLDITDLPADAVSAGDWVELFGRHVPIEHMAQCAGTVPYEIITQTGARITRIFTSNGPKP